MFTEWQSHSQAGGVDGADECVLYYSSAVSEVVHATLRSHQVSSIGVGVCIARRHGAVCCSAESLGCVWCLCTCVFLPQPIYGVHPA